MNNPTEAQVAQQLVTRILAGEKRAEQEMVERYQRGLRFILRRKTDNASLVDDIAQETWRIVLEKVRANEIRQPEKLSTFIVQTGKNQLIMYFRSSHHQTMLNQDDFCETADAAPPPEKLLEQHNLKMIVRRLLDELSTERDRELIRRLYLNQEDKSSICKDLELSDLHFNRVLFRARQRFKELWMTYVENKP